jgi:hypothetical protein
MSQVKCYTKEKKDGGQYTTCVDKDGNQLRGGAKPKQKYKIKRKRPAKQLLPAEKATGKSIDELRQLDPLELMGFLPKELRQKILDPSETGVKVGAKDFTGEYLEQINNLRQGQVEYNYFKILGRKAKGRAKGKYEIKKVDRFGGGVYDKSNYLTQQELIDIAEGRTDVIERRKGNIEQTIFPASRLDIRTRGDEKDEMFTGGLQSKSIKGYGYSKGEYENAIKDIDDLGEKLAKIVFNFETSKMNSRGQKRDFMMSLPKGKGSGFKRATPRKDVMTGRNEIYDRILKKEFEFQLVANDGKQYPVNYGLVIGIDNDPSKDYRYLTYELIQFEEEIEEEGEEIEKALDEKKNKYFLITPYNPRVLSYKELQELTYFVSEKNLKKFMKRE